MQYFRVYDYLSTCRQPVETTTRMSDRHSCDLPCSMRPSTWCAKLLRVSWLPSAVVAVCSVHSARRAPLGGGSGGARIFAHC